MAVSTEASNDQRLLDGLTDCMVASIWVAVVLMIVVWIGFLMLVGAPGLGATSAGWCGISPDAMAIIWVAALSLLKLTALTFAATAYGLWIWKRRMERRMGQ